MKNKSKSSEGKGIKINDYIKKISIFVETNKSGVYQLILTELQNDSLLGFLKLATNGEFKLTDRIINIKHL